MEKNKQVWWLHFAKLGHSVGVGIGAGAGTAIALSSLVPGYGPAIGTFIGLISGAASIITQYSDQGIASVSSK